MVRTLGEAAGVASLLSFSLIGFNDQKRIEVPGTGFRIANGLGLTAAHVADELFTKLVLPEGMPIPRQQRRWDGVEVRAAEQDPSGVTTDEVNGWWFVDGFFKSRLTDICLLMLTPGNAAARRAESRGGYLRWSLSPPAVEQRLYAFGYIKEEMETQATDVKTNFEIRYTASVQRVAVTAVFPHGRREEVLEVPVILSGPRGFDPATMPSFDVRGEISASISGGPVSTLICCTA